MNLKLLTKAYFSTHALANNTENNIIRYMPILNMLEEIHFKLLSRMREWKDQILASDSLVCPRIKKRLDVLVTESREWTTSWDEMKKFQGI